MNVVDIRRELHAHPELAYAEKRTTQLIVDTLQSFGLDPEVHAGGDRRDVRRGLAAPDR